MRRENNKIVEEGIKTLRRENDKIVEEEEEGNKNEKGERYVEHFAQCKSKKDYSQLVGALFRK